MATLLYKIAQGLLLLLVQGIVLNHVSVMGYATPMPYIYMLLTFPMGTGRKVLLLSGFLMGLISDMFTNTPGVAAAACTLLAMVQPLLLRLLAPRDSAENLTPCIATMGIGSFFCFLLFGTVLFLVVYYLLAVFSLVHLADIVINIAGGTLFTLLLMMGLACFHRNKA